MTKEELSELKLSDFSKLTSPDAERTCGWDGLCEMNGSGMGEEQLFQFLRRKKKVDNSESK